MTINEELGYMQKKKGLEPQDFVEKYKIKQLVCCFSGGKDSLAATHYVLSHLKDDKLKKYVVWVDTTIMIPPVRKFVRKVVKENGWPLIELKPENDFEEYALRFGMPTMFRRWCCYYLKLRPIFQFIKKLDGGLVGEVVGIRRDESRSRSEYPQVQYRKESRSWVYCPILFWKEEEVLNYIKANNLPLPSWYKWGIRETCQCGAFASVSSLTKVCKRYPDFFKRFIELEKKFRNGGSAFFLEGRPYYAWEIWEEIWNGKQRNPPRGP